MSSKNETALVNPSTAAEELKISVATLRKYSLLVEKTTGRDDYYQRTAQRARLYTQQNIEDLKAFHKLAKTSDLTLSEAARQVFAISDKQAEDQKKADQKLEQQANALLDSKQVVKLLTALQQTIASQNKAIADLQAQVAAVQKQNEALLDAQKQIPAPEDKFAGMPDISGIVDADLAAEPQEKTPEQKRSEVAEDMQKSEDEVRGEILRRAHENAAKRAKANVHRTLADMQLPRKKHWWDRFLS
ncbi:hypothetical protein [Lactobacillus psittaci]|uniref:Uncharacterized protein n=1 Tax=Lactobacillus psittaci DSM 15354 TaxID=1122152 RepID=A0A0R1S0Y8_9LACO|nr:hypothetical protein [Lactobacillus psittaci]KRL62791.1 hypothetical protein FC23_GL001262 [Lactobacillus psittaci DSM 15354]